MVGVGAYAQGGNATTKEIRYLAGVYKTTGNNAYLQAAERDIRYLLMMQYANGGFPQFYNDNAMINALNVLSDVASGSGGLDVVDSSLRAPAAAAVDRGEVCILKTQIWVRGQLTAWCAQYDAVTLEPAKEGSDVLPPMSRDETVGIVEFLMHRPHPSSDVRQAVNAAVEWLKAVKMENGVLPKQLLEKDYPAWLEGQGVIMVDYKTKKPVI